MVVEERIIEFPQLYIQPLIWNWNLLFVYQYLLLPIVIALLCFPFIDKHSLIGTTLLPIVDGIYQCHSLFVQDSTPNLILN